MDFNNGVLFYGTELDEHVKQIKTLLGVGYNARTLIDLSFIQWAVRGNRDPCRSIETLIHSPTDLLITNHLFDDLFEHSCILQVLENPNNKGCFFASCDKKVYEAVQQALITPIITVDSQGSIQVLPLTDLQLKKIFGEEKSVGNENDMWFGLTHMRLLCFVELEQEEGVNTTEKENALVKEEIRKRSPYSLREMGFSSDERY